VPGVYVQGVSADQSAFLGTGPFESAQARQIVPSDRVACTREQQLETSTPPIAPLLI